MTSTVEPNGPRPVKPINRPETLQQAREWQTTRVAYLNLGLCQLGAARAGYGHQLGFALLEPPCSACLPAVRGFDLDAGGGWRKASRAVRRTSSRRR
jgi:hypothetical protein